MNIFVTDKSYEISAQNLDDKRVVKMILESAQLLSTAIFLNRGIQYENIYKPTHKNHPCSLWAALNISNWYWLYNHMVSLCQEYSFRYSKTHSSESLLLYLKMYSEYIPQGYITNFVNCTRSKVVDFRNIKDVYLAYKKYLTIKWDNDKLKPKWTERKPPNWYNSI